METVPQQAEALPPSSRLLRGAPLAIIDTETTGVGDDAHIVEIAVVHCAIGGDEPVIAFRSRVRPPIAIPPEATKIHGITNGDVANAPTWAEVWPSVEAAISGRLLAAYNAPFDWRMITHENARNGLPPVAWGWIDPLVVVHRVDKYQKGKSLRAVAARWGIVLNAHGAAGDALVTAMLIPHLFRAAYRTSHIPSIVQTVDELLRWQRGAALANEADMLDFARKKGQKDAPDCAWHTIEGVQSPAWAVRTPSQPCRTCGAPTLHIVTTAGGVAFVDAAPIRIAENVEATRPPIVGFTKDGTRVVGHQIADDLADVPRLEIHQNHTQTCARRQKAS